MHEDIYIKEYDSVPDLAAGLEAYFQLYNYERPHQSLGYQVPADIHYAVKVPILYEVVVWPLHSSIR